MAILWILWGYYPVANNSDDIDFNAEFKGDCRRGRTQSKPSTAPRSRGQNVDCCQRFRFQHFCRRSLLWPYKCPCMFQKQFWLKRKLNPISFCVSEYWNQATTAPPISPFLFNQFQHNSIGGIFTRHACTWDSLWNLSAHIVQKSTIFSSLRQFSNIEIIFYKPIHSNSWSSDLL